MAMMTNQKGLSITDRLRIDSTYSLLLISTYIGQLVKATKELIEKANQVLGKKKHQQKI